MSNQNPESIGNFKAACGLLFLFIIFFLAKLHWFNTIAFLFLAIVNLVIFFIDKRRAAVMKKCIGNIKLKDIIIPTKEEILLSSDEIYVFVGFIIISVFIMAQIFLLKRIIDNVIIMDYIIVISIIVGAIILAWYYKIFYKNNSRSHDNQ